MQVDEYSCSRVTPKQLERTIVVDLLRDGDALDEESEDFLLSEEVTGVLEEILVETYNNQSFVSCDVPHFRTISHVLLERKSQSSLTFTVFADCRNCTASLPLFLPLPVPTETEEESLAEGNSTTINSTGTYGVSTSNITSQWDDIGSDISDGSVSTDVPVVLQKVGLMYGAATRQSEHNCLCPFNAVPNPSMLTAEAFVTQLNNNVLRSDYVSDNGKRVKIPTVQMVEELQEVPCSDTIRMFKSIIYIDFQLRKDQDPSANELKLLEQRFMDTYNNVAFDSCDSHFRTVLNATLEMEVTDKIKAGSGEGGAKGDQATGRGVFAIQGLCRDCPVSDTGNFPLFDDPSSGRRQSLSLVLPRTRHNHKRGSQQDQCVCPLVVSDDDNSTSSINPTQVHEEIFLAMYNAELLGNGERLEVVESALDIGEGQEVNCSGTQTRFESIVHSDIQVNLTSLTVQEAKKLEDAFKESYNLISYQTCDGHFRQVLGVELRIAPSAGFEDGGSIGGRRLQDILEASTALPTPSPNITDATNATSFLFGDTNSTNSTTITSAVYLDRRSVVPTLFKVVGECRNCPVTESGGFNLFDDGFRRRSLGAKLLDFRDWLDTTTSIINHDRSLQLAGSRQASFADQTLVCVCPVGAEPVIGNGPVANDFATELNGEIARLEEDGEASSIVTTADNIVEGRSMRIRFRRCASFWSSDRVFCLSLFL